MPSLVLCKTCGTEIRRACTQRRLAVSAPAAPPPLANTAPKKEGTRRDPPTLAVG
jgi:hypothetical protein